MITRTLFGRLTIAAVNLNAVADNAITGLPAKWRITKLTVTDVSTSLAAMLTVAGLFTAATGGGSNLISALVFTGLTGATKVSDATLVAQTDYRTETTIYFRPTTASGSAVTARIILEFEDLT